MRAGVAAPPDELPRLVALVVTGVVVAVAAVSPVVAAPHPRFEVLAARIAAWGSTVRPAVVVVAVAACGAIVPPVAKPPLATATSSLIVL